MFRGKWTFKKRQSLNQCIVFRSPDYFIPYDGVNGPDDGHKWLASHPFY